MDSNKFLLSRGLDWVWISDLKFRGRVAVSQRDADRDRGADNCAMVDAAILMMMRSIGVQSWESTGRSNNRCYCYTFIRIAQVSEWWRSSQNFYDSISEQRNRECITDAMNISYDCCNRYQQQHGSAISVCKLFHICDDTDKRFSYAISHQSQQWWTWWIVQRVRLISLP